MTVGTQALSWDFQKLGSSWWGRERIAVTLSDNVVLVDDVLTISRCSHAVGHACWVRRGLVRVGVRKDCYPLGDRFSTLSIMDLGEAGRPFCRDWGSVGGMEAARP